MEENVTNTGTTPTQENATAPTDAAPKHYKPRGGWRANSGRKPDCTARKETVCVRLPPDLVAYLRLQPSISGAVESALRFYVEEKGITL